MKEKFMFFKIYLKNNIKDFYAIYGLLILILATNFMVAALLFKLIGEDFKSNKDNMIYFISLLIFTVIMSSNIIVVYVTFFKKNNIKLSIYRMLGANPKTIFLGLIAEFLIIYIISVLLGSIVDTLIIVRYPQDFDYLNWFTFKNTALTVLILPLICVIINFLVQLYDIKKDYGAR